MKEIKKGIGMILVCILSVLLAGDDAKAQESGRIRIELEKGGKEGVVFAYAKVEDAGDLTTAEEQNEAALKLEKSMKKYDGTVITDKNGVAIIEGVEEGTYLIAAVEKGNYDNIMPFLMTVPSWNEAKQIMEYDITIIPKHEESYKEQKEAPQTNLDSSYKGKIIGAGVCMLGAVLFLNLLRRKGEDEDYF